MSVFTKVSQPELVGFLENYDVGGLVGFQGIGEGVENTNYFVDTTEGRWVLTLFERLNYDDLPFFLGLMEHLASADFPCPAPVRARDGSSLRGLNGKPAALVQRLTGQWELFPTEYHCRQVGATLAAMHIAGAGYGLRCANSRGAAWRTDTALGLLPRIDEQARALLVDELRAQSSLDFARLPQGVIHADLFKDNVLFVGSQLSGVIDFYYACNDALLYDLAVTVNDWCFDTHGELQAARLHALLGAYEERRALTSAEREAWPLALRAAALRFYLSRLQDKVNPRAGDVVHVKDPEQYRRILTHHRGDPPPARPLGQP